jgi:hypothetical protein
MEAAHCLKMLTDSTAHTSRQPEQHNNQIISVQLNLNWL